MLKKIILSLVIILIVLLTATGFLYANNKNPFNKGKSNQEISEEDISSVKVYHITSNCNHGGIISPKGNQFVEKGKSITFTITANDGYKIEWVRIDNAKTKNITLNPYTYNFTGVDKNHTIHAHFKKVK